MEIGIFLKTFERNGLDEALDTAANQRIRSIQFNMSCAGKPTLPLEMESECAEMIRHKTKERNISIAAVSGTFNMVHPDNDYRQKHLIRLRYLAQTCKEMGASVITLCTGTRDPDDMWRWHPDNNSEQAWSDLLFTLRRALILTEDTGVILAIEPEAANVINNAGKARKLLDTIQSDRLKIVMDAANLFVPDNVESMDEVLIEAFDLLGNDIILAHAKDFVQSEEGLNFVPAGKGLLNYPKYVSLLKKYDYAGPLILHGLHESDVAECTNFLRSQI